MERRIYVIAYQLFVKKYRVLVVIAFPGHEADKGVLTEGNLTAGGCGTVSDNLLCLNLFAKRNDRSLIDAGTLVGSLELNERVGILCAVLGGDDDLVSVNEVNRTCALCENYDTGIASSLIFHTGSYDRRLSNHKRNCLLLHVRTHERTGVIVVFKEGDHRGCNGYNHLRRNVDQVNA